MLVSASPEELQKARREVIVLSYAATPMEDGLPTYRRARFEALPASPYKESCNTRCCGCTFAWMKGCLTV